MIKYVVVIWLILTTSVEAIRPEAARVLREFQEYDSISKVADKLDLRIAEIEIIYAIIEWEKINGIRYSYGLKDIQKLFTMYRRLISTGRVK